LPVTLADLPKSIEGIDEIEVLIINDGSTDNTVDIALQNGVNHIVNFKTNKGLARAFEAGIEKCIELGADIIVNTDADNQYYGPDIVKLVTPILQGKADVVVGNRQTSKIKHFSKSKKILQYFGSFLVRQLSDTDVADAVSGFRAYSRETALKINILTDFSYTIENLIQLGNEKMTITSVPIRTNIKLRESRLFINVFDFVNKQVFTLIRAYSTYRALKIFITAGVIFILPGIAGLVRFLYYYFSNGGNGHVQSLVFSSILIFIGFLLLMIGIIADLISTNRKLIEKLIELYKSDKWNKQ